MLKGFHSCSYFTYVYTPVLVYRRTNACEALLFHGSPSFVRPLRVVFFTANRANTAEFVVVGLASLQVLRVQVLRSASALRREEGLLTISAVLLYRAAVLSAFLT